MATPGGKKKPTPAKEGAAIERFEIAIVGAGPSGLSAASRAAEVGISHVLLERAGHLADTTVRYQRGKFVMATPDVLPLRAPLPFAPGSREEVLAHWEESSKRLAVNCRFGSEVVRIGGAKGDFRIGIADGSTVGAARVVLALGLQGNIRELDVPGTAESRRLQYQLDDPAAHEGETVVVIGAGDSAIENALALAQRNTVILVNRRDEFARAKHGNLGAMGQAIERGDIECFLNSEAIRVETDAVVIRTDRGEARIACDLIIARIGAVPPRAFLESCGVQFPNDHPDSPPEVSRHYESNVPGLYIIGTLSGFPLIKQGLNQGFEVVEYIRGNLGLKPADEDLLKAKLGVDDGRPVDEVLEPIRRKIPLFANVNALLFRELMLESEIRALEAGDVVLRRNDYTNTFYSIVSGSVTVRIDPLDPSHVVTLGKGDFFGEMGLISGRRRTATIVARTPCVLIETNRRAMVRLINSVPEVKRVLDETAIVRHIQTNLAPHLSKAELAETVASATIQSYRQNEVLFREGEEGNSLHLIRRGSVTVSRKIAGREVVLAYYAAGNYVGEMALLSNSPRSATVRAAVNNTETIKIRGKAFKKLLASAPELRRQMEAKFRDRIAQNERAAAQPEVTSLVEFLVKQGIGDATDVLLIDEARCVGCDNCERACAETHGGVSRLDRDAGPTYATLRVPISCRHCEHPYCMVDCPPDAIHRSPHGEVYINDSCIGCGNCARNCPYDAIRMAPAPVDGHGLFDRMRQSLGLTPRANGAGQEIAVKCDMCKDLSGGPACVRACPTGAAMRVKPEGYIDLVTLARRR